MQTATRTAQLCGSVGRLAVALPCNLFGESNASMFALAAREQGEGVTGQHLQALGDQPAGTVLVVDDLLDRVLPAVLAKAHVLAGILASRGRQ